MRATCSDAVQKNSLTPIKLLMSTGQSCLCVCVCVCLHWCCHNTGNLTFNMIPCLTSLEKCVSPGGGKVATVGEHDSGVCVSTPCRRGEWEKKHVSNIQN